MADNRPAATAGRFSLAGHDAMAIGLPYRLVWRCPKAVMLAGYDRNVGGNHLELGVGTGYFLDRCRFPRPRPRVTLVDADGTRLRAGAERIARYDPETIHADVLEPLPVPAGTYDSVGMSLLHRVPGDWQAKSAAFANAASALRPGGRAFGSTILASGVPVPTVARAVMSVSNRRGAMHNRYDDLTGLRIELERHFVGYRVELHGCVAVFEATAALTVDQAIQEIFPLVG